MNVNRVGVFQEHTASVIRTRPLRALPFGPNRIVPRGPRKFDFACYSAEFELASKFADFAAKKRQGFE